MDALEWLNLILRWTHVVAAIAWIGHAFLFNELDDSLVPPEEGDPRKGLEGEVFMVHGGGFYHLEKSWAFPERLRGQLHWFRWEAAFTWLSGFFLLVVVYYLGGGVYLVDPTVAALSLPVAVGIGIGSLVLGWVVYDALCRSPLSRNGPAMGLTGLALIGGLAYALTNLLSGRAAFLHVGAVLATLMAANVWMIIIPTMRKMVAAVEHGGTLDVALGKRAKQRSRHNNYIVFPVLFLMISNHYPGLYGHRYAWLLLVGISLLGAVVKHWMNVRKPIVGIYAATVAGAVGALLLAVPAWLPDEEVQVATTSADRVPIDPDTVGSIEGVVRFEGEPPARKELQIVNCMRESDEPVFDDAVLVRDGLLQNAFVRVREGTEGIAVPPAPEEEVLVDQVGCVYVPHVVGVRVGQPVTFLNSDPVPHNVRSVTQANTTFNDMMAAKDQRLTKVFRRPEAMITAKCDVHPWMSAFVGVVEHPWFDVSGEDGAFTLEGLPPGEYVVEAWHEVFGTAEERVTVPPKGTAEVGFTFRR